MELHTWHLLMDNIHEEGHILLFCYFNQGASNTFEAPCFNHSLTTYKWLFSLFAFEFTFSSFPPFILFMHTHTHTHKIPTISIFMEILISWWFWNQLICLLIYYNLFIHSFIHLFMYLFILFLMYLLIYSFIQSFIYSFVCFISVGYCIRYIFRESNFSRIGTSRHFREWLNSRSRSTNIAYTSRIHASGSEVNIFACC